MNERNELRKKLAWSIRVALAECSLGQTPTAVRVEEIIDAIDEYASYIAYDKVERHEEYEHRA